jgi:aldehyde dehydrogenase (NAD(P)+)
VYGGGAAGEFLTNHELVQAIHITGSSKTHDLIVYGPGEGGARRKAADQRLVDKPITSELGGVGATIVLPGPWSDADFATKPSMWSPTSCTTPDTTALPLRS